MPTTDEQALFNRATYALMSGHGSMPSRSRHMPRRTAELLRDLERIECEVAPADWENELRRVAAAYNLTMPE